MKRLPNRREKLVMWQDKVRYQWDFSRPKDIEEALYFLADILQMDENE